MTSLWADLPELLNCYGYYAIAAVIALESAGLPLPGETILIVASAYAGTTGLLQIQFVILAALCGAVLGDNCGFWIGRQFGLPFLLRWGPHFGMSTTRLSIGRQLFQQHGGKAVFFGRFVAFLRVLAGLLAGMSVMGWREFLFFNFVGGAAWASSISLLAFMCGRQAERVTGPLGVALLLLALGGIGFGWYKLKEYERRLEAQAAANGPSPTES